MELLPHEIQEIILLFLTEEERIYPILTCKLWYQLIKKNLITINNKKKLKRCFKEKRVLSIFFKH